VVDEYHFVHGACVVVLCIPEHLLAQFVGDRLDAFGTQVFKHALGQPLKHVLPALDRHVVNLEVELQ